MDGPKPSRTLRHAAEFAAAGLVAPEAVPALAQVEARYAAALTPVLADAIRPGDPADPVARQFVPGVEELAPSPEELADPIGDDPHSPVKGIVHRYPDRVLLKPLHVCPVYCRFCFRRERVGPGGEALRPAELDAAIDYVREHPAIREVILSGGDPLMLSPVRLGAIAQALDAIPHVEVIRLHTRVPVADPDRVTPALLEALDVETAVWLVAHVNHANELTDAARAACRRIVRAGIPMLSQSVLLRGVNDDAAVLAALFRALVALRIKPYYLHHADLAPGTARFRTTIVEGQALMRALRGDVSGLCQPTYVLDIPGGHGKVPLVPCYVGDGEVEDPWGGRHAYPPRVASPDPL